MGYKRSAEADAREMMRELSINPFDLPIDVFEIASDLGIDVWLSDLGDNTAGIIERRKGRRPQIYLNVDDHLRRQRFTCGHELGHFYGHERNRFPGSLSSIDKRDDVAGRGTEPKEIYANSFAAELLMPSRAVHQLFDDDLGLSQLASRFNVSQAAMSNRLANLGLYL